MLKNVILLFFVNSVFYDFKPNNAIFIKRHAWKLCLGIWKQCSHEVWYIFLSYDIHTFLAYKKVLWKTVHQEKTNSEVFLCNKFYEQHLIQTWHRFVLVHKKCLIGSLKRCMWASRANLRVLHKHVSEGQALFGRVGNFHTGLRLTLPATAPS